MYNSMSCWCVCLPIDFSSLDDQSRIAKDFNREPPLQRGLLLSLLLKGCWWVSAVLHTYVEQYDSNVQWVMGWPHPYAIRYRKNSLVQMQIRKLFKGAGISGVEAIDVSDVCHKICNTVVESFLFTSYGGSAVTLKVCIRLTVKRQIHGEKELVFWEYDC